MHYQGGVEDASWLTMASVVAIASSTPDLASTSPLDHFKARMVLPNIVLKTGLDRSVLLKTINSPDPVPQKIQLYFK